MYHLEAKASLLHDAVAAKQTELVAALLRCTLGSAWVGGLAAVTTKEGITPMHMAAEAKDDGRLLSLFTESVAGARAFFTCPAGAMHLGSPCRSATSAQALLVRNKLQAAFSLVRKLMEQSVAQGHSLEGIGLELARRSVRALLASAEAQTASEVNALQVSTLRLAKSMLDNLAQGVEIAFYTQQVDAQSSALELNRALTTLSPSDLQECVVGFKDPVLEYCWIRHNATQAMPMDLLACFLSFMAAVFTMFNNGTRLSQMLPLAMLAMACLFCARMQSANRGWYMSNREMLVGTVRTLTAGAASSSSGGNLAFQGALALCPMLMPARLPIHMALLTVSAAFTYGVQPHVAAVLCLNVVTAVASEVSSRMVFGRRWNMAMNEKAKLQ